ncbi:MAG TPA: cytochrome P450 [Pseudonocardiaceae bacterium]|nr:cytochrome P450 [Pseudonocardiaceae bacterium]
MTHGPSADPPELSGQEFDRNPSPAYQYLRDHCPAYRMPLSGGAFAWLITRYDDAVAAMADSRLSKSPDNASAAWRRSGMGLPLDHRPSLASHMVNADPPEHGRLRRLVAGAFAPKRMESLRTRTQQVADRILDRIAPARRADLVESLAYPLPITIICDLLGIPEHDRGSIQQWVAVLDSSGQHTSHSDLLTVTDAMDSFLAAQVAAKRRLPGDDLISELLSKQHVGAISDDEITSMAFLLLIGGHETATALISNALLALLVHRDLADAARAELDLVPQIIEESLRLDSPIRNATWHFPIEPVVIAGQVMQTGDPILVSLLAANRDPAAFDDADEFQIGRAARHIAFGHGPHACIGAALARMEGQIAISTVLRALPHLRLAAPSDELQWWPSPIMRSLYALPVAW